MVDKVAAPPQAGSLAAPGSNVLDRILLAVDGSPASDAAVRSVATLVRSHKGPPAGTAAYCWPFSCP
jgi:hypothetical protein